MIEKCSILCDFCDALNIEGDIGQTINFKKIVMEELDSRLIMETENFAVIAGIGPLTEGYLILLTKNHYLSMAEIEMDMISELKELYDQVLNLLGKYFSNAIVFEHGPMAIKENLFSGYGGGSCMDHAHLHFLPMPDDEFLSEVKNELSFIEITDLTEIKKQFEKKIPYLYVQDLNGHMFIFDAPEIESQYMRKKIAKHILKADKWNWRLDPGPKEIIKTVNVLRKQKP